MLLQIDDFFCELDKRSYMLQSLRDLMFVVHEICYYFIVSEELISEILIDFNEF